MKLDEVRAGVFEARLTAHELSTVIAAAKLALRVMEGDDVTPPEAARTLRAVLEDFDRAVARVRPGGRE